MRIAGKHRHEAGWVAVHRDGDLRHVLMSGSEPGRIVIDGKGASMSPHLLIELAARDRSVIPADALHVLLSASIPFSRVRHSSR